MTNLITGRDPASGKGIQIAVEQGRIAAIEAIDKAPPHFLCAGLVDLQVNGYGGIDLNSGRLDAEEVVGLTGKLVELGVTTYLPTLITASEASLVGALKAIAEARRRSALVRQIIPFVHVEGPAISPLDGPRGAHPRSEVRPPSLAEFDRWQVASGGLVGMVTLAPEYPEAAAYTRELSGRGVVVALGHSAAPPEAIHAAAAAGARLSTHLGNGAAATLPRHPNVIWSQLADERLAATFIADGHHLEADAFKAMLRAKGLDRSVLVSDCVAAAGLAPGRYEQAVGGTVEVSGDGRIGMAGTPYLAGAGLPLSKTIPIAMRMAGLSLPEALRLATVNPGRFAGSVGRLKIGASADLIRFDFGPGERALRMESVLVGGEVQ